MLYLFGFLLTLAVTIYAPWSWASSAPQVFFFGVAAGAVLAFFGLPLAFSFTDPPPEFTSEEPASSKPAVQEGTPPSKPPLAKGSQLVRITNPKIIQEFWDALAPIPLDRVGHRTFVAFQWGYRHTSAVPGLHTLVIDHSKARYIDVEIIPDPIPELP